MWDDIKAYLAEMVREAPRAWKTGSVVATVAANAAMFALIYLGWRFSAYPAGYVVAGTALIAVLDVLVILPFKLWQANKEEIETLTTQIEARKSKRDEAKARLWDLREEGVKIRNEGKYVRLLPPWTKKFEQWHANVLEQAAIFSEDLRRSLNPVDKIAPESNEAVAVLDQQHQKNVSVMSEILVRVHQHLNRP